MFKSLWPEDCLLNEFSHLKYESCLPSSSIMCQFLPEKRYLIYTNERRHPLTKVKSWEGETLTSTSWPKAKCNVCTALILSQFTSHSHRMAYSLLGDGLKTASRWHGVLSSISFWPGLLRDRKRQLAGYCKQGFAKGAVQNAA